MTNVVEGVRFEPDLGVTSASRAATAEEFASFDRRAGNLMVNRWTIRLLRAVLPRVLPEPDLSGVTVSEESDAGRGMVVVRPETCTGTGAMLCIHGGGYVMGAPQDIVAKAAALARVAGVPVFCPRYRLGPEHPFPAGNDDCHAGFTWLVDNAERLNVDPDRIVIGGWSAGGGMAAGLAQRLLDDGGRQPSAQLLVYPMLDDRTAANRDLDKPKHRVWNNRSNLFGWTGYLGHAPGQSPAPYAVPARRDDLSGLPPAWVGAGTPDLFLDESRDYTERLRAAGVEVTYMEIDGGIHGFDGEDSPLAEAFIESAAAFVKMHTA